MEFLLSSQHNHVLLNKSLKGEKKKDQGEILLGKGTCVYPLSDLEPKWGKFFDLPVPATAHVYLPSKGLN